MAYRYTWSYRKGTTHGRAGNTVIPLNAAIEGDWNIIDDRTGFKVKASQSIVSWDGLLTSDDVIEPRTPQDFVRSVRDQKPLPRERVRPKTPELFGSETEGGLINSLLRRK